MFLPEQINRTYDLCLKKSGKGVNETIPVGTIRKIYHGVRNDISFVIKKIKKTDSLNIHVNSYKMNSVKNIHKLFKNM